MPLFFNLLISVLLAIYLALNFVFPFFEIHLANANLAKINIEVNKVIDENRNQIALIKPKIEEKFSSMTLFDQLMVTTSSVNDFHVVDLEFYMKNFFRKQKSKNKIKVRYLVNEL
jgi:hypothetical protein